MLKINFISVFVTLLFLTIGITSASLITLDFEGLPDTYYYGGDNTNIGNYYPGVTFGPDATILDKNIYGYNDSSYPPHSGDAVFFSASYSYVDIVFDNPTTYVEGWFTFGDTTGSLYLEAYNSSDALVDQDSMSQNLGTNGMMSVSWTDIKRVRISDTGNFWTGDDISYESGSAPIPEPGTLLLMGSGLMGIAGYARLKFGRKKKI